MKKVLLSLLLLAVSVNAQAFSGIRLVDEDGQEIGTAANPIVTSGGGVSSGCLEFASGSGGEGEEICNDNPDQFDFKDDDGTVYATITEGNIALAATADPCSVYNVATAGDTDFWIGVTEDGGGDDDDLFEIGDGTTCGTNPVLSITAAGYVGIGDASPDDEFELELSQNADTNIRVTNPNTGAGAAAGILVAADAASGTLRANSAAYTNDTRQDALVLVANSNSSGGLYVATTASAPITFQTGGVNTRMTIDSGGDIAISATNVAPSSLFIVDPPAAQTIAAGNTITANACGTLKLITAAGAVTTDTTNTFTAPAAANEGCCMEVLNVGANAITLDQNALTFSNGAADVVLGANDSAKFCSTGASGAWYQIGATGNN